MSADELVRLRIEYETAGLEREHLADDPIVQWWHWYREAVAAGVTEPNAMVVATVDAEGRPDSRFVLVRDVDARGFTFYGNHGSAKGTQIASTGVASLTFGWLQLHRQVRVRGTAHPFSDAEADAYWAGRPRESQLASAASPQSQVIADRAELEARIAEQERRWEGLAAVPRPAHWGGFRVAPSEVEFWQGRVARAHDRFRYRRAGTAWVVERLAP